MYIDSKPPFRNDDLSRLAPAEVLTRMQEHTDDTGILCLYEMPCDDQNDLQNANICRWKMEWNCKDCRKLISDFEDLYFCLKKLASLQGRLTAENARDLLSDEETYRVWNALIRDFADCGTDENTIRELSGRLSAGERITEEEANVLDAFTRSRAEECVRRIGEGPAAYDVVMRAKRVHLLIIMKAPAWILVREANLMAEAMALHRFGKSMNTL